MDISFALRKFKKSIAGFTILALLASFVSFSGLALAFDDTSGHWAEGYIDELYAQGVVSGKTETTFAPNDFVTRYEEAKMAVLAFLGEGAVDSSYNDGSFSDVPNDHWAVDYVYTAKQFGIMTGNPDGTFKGNNNTNRAEVSKVIAEAAGLSSTTNGSDIFADVASGAWYDGYVGALYAWTVVDGKTSTTFDPAGLATRAELSKMIVNGQSPVERDIDTPPSSTATLKVAVSSSTPAASTIPSGASSVKLASWDFTALNDDVVLDDLTLHHFGITSLPSDHQVYIYNGAERLTSGKSVNSTTNEVTFVNLNFGIDKGDTATLTLRADVGDVYNGGSGSVGEVGFEIESASAVESNAVSTTGTFPASGNLFTLSTTVAGVATITANGTVTDANVGQDDATIAKLKIATDSVEAGSLTELGLLLAGSVNTSDVENFELYASGIATPIATAAHADSQDVVRFVINSDVDADGEEGLTITKGGSKTFTVKADFNTGRSGDTVQMYVDEAADVVIVGQKYNHGLGVVFTAYDGNTCGSDCSSSTLVGGDITISSSGPASMDIATNSDDNTILQFNISTVTDVTFKNFPVSLTTSDDSGDSTEGLLNGTAANFTNIELVDVDTGNVLVSSVDSDVFKGTSITGSTIDESTAGQLDDEKAYHLFTDDWSLLAGEEMNLALVLDVENVSTLSGMTITAGLELGTSYPEIRDVDNKILGNAASLVPTSPIAGKTMTVVTPGLSLALGSTPPSGGISWVKGSTEVPFTGIVFACDNGSGCLVTEVALVGAIDENSTGGFTAGVDNSVNVNEIVGSVWLETADGTIVASPASVTTATGVVTFSDMNWQLEPGETALATVMGNISANAFKNSTAEDIAFAISSASNVVVEDDEGITFTPTGTVNASYGTYVTVLDGGSLTITTAGDTPKEDIAVSGDSGEEISKFKLDSTGESFTVKKLSVNARQNGIAEATDQPGNYDNNIARVWLTYTDSTGTEVSKSSILSKGTANFSGLDIFVGKDDDATILVSADLNPISGGLATAGEFVDLNLAFNDFEAQTATETYKADKIDADVSATSDLDFGTITWTDSTDDFDSDAVGTTTLGGSTTFTIDDGAGATDQDYPVGTLLCADDDDGGTCSSEDIYVVTGTSSATAELTVTATLIDDAGDGTYDDGDAVLYALPGTGYLTGSNQMHVYESKPTLTLSASSPSGSTAVNPSQTIFAFNVAAASGGDIEVRPSVDYTTCVAGTGTTLTTAANTTLAVDGSSCQVTAVDGGTDSVLFANTADLSSYAYASFWIRWTDADANLATLLPSELSLVTADANDGTEDQATALAASNFEGSPSYLIEGTWYLAKDVAMPTGTNSSDTFIGLLFGDADTVAAGDIFYLDQFRVYNEKLELNLVASSDDLHRTNDQSTTGGSGPVAAILKEGGSTVATGYIDTVPVDANGDGAEDATDGASASVVFIPTSTQGLIEISSNSSKGFTLVTNTQSLISEEGSSNDTLTVSMNLGSASGGTVTAGDFWWNESNATVRWVGEVSNTTLVGNTLIY